MAELKKYNTFISYPSKLKLYAKEVYEYLVGSGLKVYWDGLMEPGDVVVETLSGAIRDSNSIVVIIGPDGIGPWQNKEIEYVRWEKTSKGDSEKKRIIPILVSGGCIDHKEVPSFIKEFSHIDFKGDIKNSPVTMQELIKSIFKLHIPIIDDFERPITIEQANGLISDTINFYDSYAENYYEAWKNKIPLDAMEPFLSQIGTNSNILDAGCGPGHHALHLHRNGYGVQGIDLSRSALKIAEQHANDIKFSQMDMRNMQFERNQFDAIWACGSTVHLPREMMVNQLFEFLRVIKPNGLIEKRVKTWVDIVARAPSDKRVQRGLKH